MYTMDATPEFPSLLGSPRTPARAFAPVKVSPRGAGSQAAAISTPAPAPDSDFRHSPQESFAPRQRSEVVCRVLNVIVALILLIVSFPITIAAAVFVKLSSPGPIFYSQTRVGIDRRWNRTRALYERRREDLGGSQFTIYKFRSMRVDAEVGGQAVWATKDDDRVTAVGKFMRGTRIDEIPQLFNVLKGDMNVVGPRPERPSIFVRLREDIELFPVRQRVKPGITGWAQINRSYDTDIDGVREKLRLDIEYLQQQSFVTDLKIMLGTIPVVLFRRGGW